jgi:hypothetical protein
MLRTHATPTRQANLPHEPLLRVLLSFAMATRADPIRTPHAMRDVMSLNGINAAVPGVLMGSMNKNKSKKNGGYPNRHANKQKTTVIIRVDIDLQRE